MAAVQHRATTRTSNTDNSTTKTKSKATSARKSPATKRKRVSAETARAAAALKGLAVEAPAPSIEANEPGQFGRINVMDITPAEERGIEMEIVTAAAVLASGSDAVIMRHPEAIRTIAAMIGELV